MAKFENKILKAEGYLCQSLSPSNCRLLSQHSQAEIKTASLCLIVMWEVIVMSYMHVYTEIRNACYTLKQIIISSLCIRIGFRLSVWMAT